MYVCSRLLPEESPVTIAEKPFLPFCKRLHTGKGLRTIKTRLCHGENGRAVCLVCATSSLVLSLALLPLAYF